METTDRQQNSDFGRGDGTQGRGSGGDSGADRPSGGDPFAGFRGFGASGWPGGMGGTVAATVFRQPSWVIRTALLLGALTALVVAAIFILPVLLVTLAAALVLGGAAGVANWARRLGRRTGGDLEGRRNVRVITRRVD